MSRSQPLALLALALLVSAGCQDQPITAPVPDEEPQVAKSTQQPQQQLWTSDDEFARVARAEVPGFAGYYLQNDGTPVILLKDHRQRDAAERYLAPYLANARVGRNEPLKAPIVRKVAHDFADLKGWFDKLDHGLSREGVYMLGIDEVGNRVFVGVRDEPTSRAVRREAARLRVPPGVLNVEIRPTPEMRITLQDRTSYLAGGYKIEAFTNGGCTLGFNAVYQGVWVFVTASHCTWTTYADDGGTFTQPTYFAGNEIGWETRDRGMYICGSITDGCRWSDAAYVQHNGSRTIAQGKIAFTEQATGGPAPNLTVLGYYDIIRRYSGDVPVGTVLTKTGQRSGTTFGQVIDSCLRITGTTRHGTPYELRCQDVSKVWSRDGDSGSPMYRRVTTGQVELYGILWGGPGTDFTTTYSSRLGYIEYDLGSLTNLCAPGWGC